jgi:hypothetical protein
MKIPVRHKDVLSEVLFMIQITSAEDYDFAMCINHNGEIHNIKINNLEVIPWSTDDLALKMFIPPEIK